MIIDNKMKCLMMSHEIIDYADDLKERGLRILNRKSKTKDKSEALLIDCELEVISGLVDKLGEMMGEIEEKLEFKK